MKRALVLSLCTPLMALSLVACDQVKKIDEGDDSGSGSAVPAEVQERLTRGCAVEGGACHTSDNASLVDLSAAAAGAWLDQSGPGGPYVTFGNVNASFLVEKMLPAPSSGGQMPPANFEVDFTEVDVAVIAGWVAGVEFPDGDEGGETGDPTTDSDGETDPTMGGETDTGSDLTLCSLEAIDPTVTSPVDAGDEAGKIPTSVGAALERNCGCHYVTEADPPYFPFSGGTQLQTLANFTNLYAGANMTYTGEAAWVAVQDRVINQRNMPTAICETEGGGLITDADFALFEAWFEQEVPDGANFTPPG